MKFKWCLIRLQQENDSIFNIRNKVICSINEPPRTPKKISINSCNTENESSIDKDVLQQQKFAQKYNDIGS
jgi:hypothetical protein